MPIDVVLRTADDLDLPAIAEIHLASRQGAGTAFPRSVHTDDDARSWVTHWDLATTTVWVAHVNDQMVGYVRWTSTWVDDLYVLPQAQGRGVGGALLELVKSRLSAGFSLWVFESNRSARDFYHRHGLVRLERTDGSANEERAPDIRLVWPGREPLACFRTMMDEVDLLLGDVLARRTALMRVVQDHTRATSARGEAIRDLDREVDIVHRVAPLVPELGVDQVARIVRVILAEAFLATGESPT